MSRRVALTHVIEERYVRPVTLSTHWLRLRPAAHARATVTAHSLRVRTEPHFVNWVQDAFQNRVARVDFPEPVRRMAIEVGLIAEIADSDPFDFLLDAGAVEHPFAYDPQLRRELAPYLRLDAPGPRLARWLAALPRGRVAVVDRIREMTLAIHDGVAVSTATCARPLDLEATLAAGAGPPVSLAWLLVQGLRALGLAARFTSGYRVGDAGDGVSASLHAWSDVYLPGAGWIGLDPASGLLTDATYLPLACAPDPLEARTVSGFREACDYEASESVVVRVLVPAPRSGPYGDAEWAQITALGRQTDTALHAADVRLAIGRELAFVSAEHGGQAEWRTTALGPTKRAVAGSLLAALRARSAPGALVHAGSGEWFAGEPLPRWRLSCIWRADGRPVCRDPSRLGASLADDEVTMARAEAFGRTLARALGVPSRSIVPAFEDLLCRLHGNDVPVPSSDELRDPDRRRALADRLSEDRTGPPVGFVLPLAWDFANDRWRSGAWTFRRRRLYLLDGSLPMGVRLPLESLPPRDGAEIEDPERCPFAPRDALPDFHAAANETFRRNAPQPIDAPASRTAVCIEVRDGRLCVFIPPLGRVEQYLGLVAAIEVAAEHENVTVAVEGYEPPDDVRLHRIVVEPEVGALRVALPASEGTDAHLALLDVVYADAARLGLRGERVYADGVHEPAGVVTPVALGGPTPELSPFLRRPEILRSLVVHWQRHPSLSYLFAGGLVGPGGPAPRIDEGRVDALDELAIALERLPRGDAYPPWLPDRLLRHLLADATGDGRRAELSIERLYDPARASRRLGELAVRSVGAAPCARTAALQSLLVSAIVARFARAPVDGTLTPWGAELHDRFLLPTVLWNDFRAVLSDLDAAGFPFQLAWFIPFLDAQFPRLGSVQLGDVALELRGAHEPWPVLAEEATGGGMARFVDTANARIEVRITGSSPCHVLVCNGQLVPLRPCGETAARVAGVRYKRWSPPATLHPTIPPVGELVFDLLDAWTGWAIGGCRFVPLAPEPVGPVAAPPVVAEMRRERDDRPPRVIGGLVGQRRIGGHFSAGGSGVMPMATPPERPGSAWVLDLTELP